MAELGPLVFINLDSEADTEQFREDFREVEARLLERNLMVGTLLQLHSAVLHCWPAGHAVGEAGGVPHELQLEDLRGQLP